MFDLDGADDDALEHVSDALQLGLTVEEMATIRDQFASRDRGPRDAELQALASAWSEHCCYKTSRPLLREHVYGIAEDELVCRDDAGVMPFGDGHAYVVKIESHNHPSAVEPYGGAATGVGGVLRDVACMGAQPVALADPLYFGSLDVDHDDLPPGTKHPSYLLEGVVSGIRDYGNRVGIPTVTGQVHFHDQYLTNCIVNVGCVGVMDRDHLIRSRAGDPDDRYILLGGRTGRDGIHGVTFASEELDEDAEEERSAVQLGDAITKEPLLHAVLEANEAGLLTGMKDLGGGGLSCAAGEMALDAGVGASIHLDDVPTKEPGMTPWEVWVSESQERMLVTVHPDDVDDLLAICDVWDVEAADIGQVTEDQRVRADWEGTPVVDMDAPFLYEGPEYERPAEPPAIEDVHEPPAEPDDLGATLVDLLETPQLGSRAPIVRQYDHEVRGNTLLKPLQGRMGAAAHGDATVLRPLRDEDRGLALAVDANPHLTRRRPGRGTTYAVDEIARNLAAVGARLDGIADCLNFPNPERPERMGRIEASIAALGEAARTLEVPFVSGNVSMYNESPTHPIPPTPSLLGVGIHPDVTRAVTTDLKSEGHRLYLAGPATTDEMGGSAYYRAAEAESNMVPTVDLDRTEAAAETLVQAVGAGEVAAAHDVAEGGLAVAAAEMALGGDVGARLSTDALADLRPDHLLFGESATRWILEARDPGALEDRFESAGVGLAPLGEVGGTGLSVPDLDLEASLEDLRAAYERPLRDHVG